MYIKKSGVKKIGSSILEDINDFYSDIKKIEKIVDEINLAWDGADALRYVNQMENFYLPRLYEMQKIINSYGEYLNNIPNAYELLDDSFSSKNIDT